MILYSYPSKCVRATELKSFMCIDSNFASDNENKYDKLLVFIRFLSADATPASAVGTTLETVNTGMI